MSLFAPRTSFIQSPFSARYEYITKPEPEPEPMMCEGEDIEECMEEKRDIVKEREDKKKKRLPGERLLKKLFKKQQLEDSLVRVVKNLHI
mgnify:CR=1 FL=1